MKKWKIALIGISGFGKVHVRVLSQLLSEGRIELKSVCDVNYDANRETIEELAKAGVRYYKDYREMLAAEKDIDIVGVSTPIHLHKQMSIDIMEAGAHVFLEKPPAVTIQDIDAIIHTSKRTGKRCGVNFMMTCGDAFVLLKKQITDGVLGEIKSISGAGLWKRTEKYYARNRWAGKLLLDNQYVLDGVMNNPLPHLLNNMLQLACLRPESAGGGRSRVEAVTAELYHANPIDGDDTSCVKIEMDSGTCLYYYATVCNTDSTTPRILVEGTKGSAEWTYENQLTTCIHGESKEYRYGTRNNIETIAKMYQNMCAVLEGSENELYCSVEATRDFILATNGAFESSGGIHAVPSLFTQCITDDDSVLCHVTNIESIIADALTKKTLFSEMDTPWAVAGKRFDVRDYKQFTMFRL